MYSWLIILIIFIILLIGMILRGFIKSKKYKKNRSLYFIFYMLFGDILMNIDIDNLNIDDDENY